MVLTGGNYEGEIRRFELRFLQLRRDKIHDGYYLRSYGPYSRNREWATDLIDVAVDSAGEILGVIVGEPHSLPDVLALAGFLVV